MAPSNVPPSFSEPGELLSTFVFERVLSQDTRTLVVYILGSAVPTSTKERCSAILKVEKTPYAPSRMAHLATPQAWAKLRMVTSNDMYATMLAWPAPGDDDAAVQLSSICPASPKHIKKYSEQPTRLVRETPELYKRVVRPYIEGLPAGQVNWVYNILDGLAETENVLYRDTDPETGFVLTPDLKWDQTTLSSMYLLVLTQTRKIRSLRDLRVQHLPLLRKIRKETERVAMDKYGIGEGVLRMFIHYQPTYYHFHVHVTHVSYIGFQGITVGQAHLLDDVIDNLELEEKRAVPVDESYYATRTLTYALGEEHGLYAGLSQKE